MTPKSPANALPAADPAAGLAALSAALHAAGTDIDGRRAALAAAGDWFECDGVLRSLAGDAPGDLADLARRVGDCADHGLGACVEDSVKRSRCSAFARHLEAAAGSVDRSLRARLGDELPPTWIVDRQGRVLAGNAATFGATAIPTIDGLLAPRATAARGRLPAALAELDAEARLAWHEADGRETVLRLRRLADGECIAVTLVPEAPAADSVAPQLATQFGLTGRQSELAAHLLAGLTLTDSARAMGISRHTANEHLAALLRRVGVEDRKQLQLQLRRATQR